MSSRRAAAYAAVSLLTSVLPPVSWAQDPVDAGAAELAKAIATDFLKSKLPASLELYYLDAVDGDAQSLALRYDWSSNQEWKDLGTGTDFGGKRTNFFARGNYVHKEDVNPAELSELGASWSRRWFPVRVANPLTAEQGRSVAECVQGAEDFETTVDDCRERLGFGATRMSYWYVEVDGHAKMEGDQQFDQRHYVYGIEASFSRSLGLQRAIVNPILTLALEQVDPKGDTERAAVSPAEDTYDRVYAKLGFTGIVASVREQPIKLNFSVRYFSELSPEQAIEDAGLDAYRYSVVALQVPAALFPGFDNTRNSFVLSYANGKLPFNRSSESAFELGFRHDIDFAELF